MSDKNQRVDVLGVGISALNLDSAKQTILDRLQRREKGYICVTGVHGVMEAQDDPGFRRILNESFLTTPDGMPMVWISWLNGRKEVDRVYGPDLMLEMAEATRDGKYTHFLYGGRPGIAELLQKRLEARYPGIRIVGTYTPPFGPLSSEEQGNLRERFRQLKPDMTWIGLSTPKQERFMADYLPKLDTTIMCGVGAAFDFHSKVVKQAPRWIQRSGFEWLYRTFQEPKRLLPRYLRNNTRFLWRYGLEQLGLARSEDYQGKRGRKRLAFLGIRGIPGLYSGFETFVEELGPRLVRDGWDVTVYCRSHLYPERQKEFQGMKLVYLPAIRSKSLETITHTVLSCLHSVLHRYDLVYLCGVGNALTSAILHLGGSRVVINVDGDDFRRPKWHWFARWWLRKSESWATRLADRVIADNTAIQRRYQQSYGFTPDLIGYGSPLAERPKSTEILQRLGVGGRDYILCVGRISPENRVDLLVRAHRRSGVKTPLVIVGSYGYETRYFEECRRAAAQNVVFAGPIYGDGYRELSLHAKMFVLPAAIEATRVVLVDQLGFGAAIVFQDCPASREVLGEAGEPFAPEQPEESLAGILQKLEADGKRLEQLRVGALARAQACYNWEKVTEQYEALFREVLPAARTS